MVNHHITTARHLRLSPPPPPSTTILYEPTSLSLALQHPDSSFSLYPNTTPLTSTTTTTTITTISPPSSSAAFLHLRSTNFSRVIFLVSSPYLARNSILLRFYILQETVHKFVKVKARVDQSELSYDEKKMGVLLKVNNGVGIKVVGGVNVFVVWSVSDKKVWVFGVKGGVGDEEVKVMRTAVIECESPVFTVCVSVGFLVLGEENGVRVFNLRPLLKGRVKKDEKLKLVNGSAGSYVKGGGRKLVNGNVEEKIGKRFENSAKLKPVKMRQDSKEGGVCFVAFKSNEIENQTSSKVQSMSHKAISVHFLAHNKFLILDSVGELYLLSLTNSIPGSESSCEMKKLTLTMKVQNVAVLPGDFTRAQTIWLSDGHYTIHAIIVSDTDTSANENETNDIEEKIQSAATEVIFTSEKIQDIVPLTANAVLLLGQELKGRNLQSHVDDFRYEIPGPVFMFKRVDGMCSLPTKLSHCNI